MRQKILTLFSVFLPLMGWTQPVSELKELDQKIAGFKEQIHRIELEEMHEEVEGQGLMLADWPKYSQEVKKIRENEKKVQDLKEKLEQLEQRRAELIKQQNS